MFGSSAMLCPKRRQDLTEQFKQQRQNNFTKLNQAAACGTLINEGGTCSGSPGISLMYYVRDFQSLRGRPSSLYIYICIYIYIYIHIHEVAVHTCVYIYISLYIYIYIYIYLSIYLYTGSPQEHIFLNHDVLYIGSLYMYIYIWKYICTRSPSIFCSVIYAYIHIYIYIYVYTGSGKRRTPPKTRTT